VAELTAKIEELQADDQLKYMMVLLQLYDSSVFLAGGLGGSMHLLKEVSSQN
jgi:hypothetical protein